MQDKHPESNVTNNDSRTLVPASNKSESFKGNFGQMQMEISRLEEDLKYMTGKGDRAELQAKIAELKLEAEGSRDGQMIIKENEKNFEVGMSFDDIQKNAMNNFYGALKIDRVLETLKSTGLNFNLSEAKNDLEIKSAIDIFVKEYRSKRNNFPADGYYSNYGELDKLVLDYESAFSIDAEPLVDQAKKLEKEKRENKAYVENKLQELRNAKQRLLEAKANAPIKILGGKDQTEIRKVEEQIDKIKSNLRFSIVESVRRDMGLDINAEDLI